MADNVTASLPRAFSRVAPLATPATPDDQWVRLCSGERESGEAGGVSLHDAPAAWPPRGRCAF